MIDLNIALALRRAISLICPIVAETMFNKISTGLEQT